MRAVRLFLLRLIHRWRSTPMLAADLEPGDRILLDFPGTGPYFAEPIDYALVGDWGAPDGEALNSRVAFGWNGTPVFLTMDIDKQIRVKKES